MEIPLLKDMLIIIGLGIFVLFLFSRLRIPLIVGYLLTGMIAGPYGFALVGAVKEVEIMAEIGVILLLFSLGLEFSFARLLQLRKAVLIGGSVQVGLTLSVTYFVMEFLGLPRNQAIFVGFLVALSSTAIVLKLLQENGEVDTPHGRTTVGILIFQDVMIVPMMMLTPLLGGVTGSGNESLLIFAAKLLFLLIFIYTGTKWFVPKVLLQITRTRNRELFLMSIAFLAFSVAWLTSMLGLSLALGAFLAGLIVSESEYSHGAFANIVPLRDLFLSFFFVSIGMLLSVRTISDQFPVVMLFVLSVLFLKILTAGIAALLLGYPLRTVLLVAFALAQIGEFSFILSKVGMNYSLMHKTSYQIFLAVSVLTMMLTPFLLKLGTRLEQKLSGISFPGNRTRRKRFVADIPSKLENHLIIIGFGLNGRNLVRGAQAAGIPFVVIDLNPDTILKEKKKGIPIFWGDATHADVLGHARIESARVLVIAINDAAATRRIIRISKQLKPDLYMVARTRYVSEVQQLFKLGADEVIPEEFETSIELFHRVLEKYGTEKSEINKLITEIRADGYRLLRKF